MREIATGQRNRPFRSPSKEGLAVVASYYRTESRPFVVGGEIAPCPRPLPPSHRKRYSAELVERFHAAFDEHKPADALSRRDALFLFEKLEDAKAFLVIEDSLDAQVYQVRPQGTLLRRCDWAWCDRVLNLLEQEEQSGCDERHRIKLRVDGYWQGKESPIGATRWEILCESATVEAIVMDRRECKARRVSQGWRG